MNPLAVGGSEKGSVLDDGHAMIRTNVKTTMMMAVAMNRARLEDPTDSMRCYDI